MRTLFYNISFLEGKDGRNRGIPIPLVSHRIPPYGDIGEEEVLDPAYLSDVYYTFRVWLS